MTREQANSLDNNEIWIAHKKWKIAEQAAFEMKDIDELTAQLQQLRNSIGQNICIHHNDAERLEASKRCPVCDMMTVKQLYNRIKVLR